MEGAEHKHLEIPKRSQFSRYTVLIQHLMFLLQFLLKQTNKEVPGCVCRLPHVHSSSLPTTVTRRRRHKHGEELLKKGSADQGITTVPGSSRGTVCSGKHLLFIPGKEREQRPWEKLNQISTSQTAFRHDGDFPVQASALCTPCSPESSAPAFN